MKFPTLHARASIGLGRSLQRVAERRGYNPLLPTTLSVVRESTVLGAEGSGTCYRQQVSLARVALIDGAF